MLDFAMNCSAQLVLINDEETPMDKYCDLVIREKIENVMEQLMPKLLINVQGHQKAYKLQVDLNQDGRSVQFFGLNQLDRSYMSLKRIEVLGLNKQIRQRCAAEGQEEDGMLLALG